MVKKWLRKIPQALSEGQDRDHQVLGIGARLFALSLFYAWAPWDWYTYWQFNLKFFGIGWLLFRPFNPWAWIAMALPMLWMSISSMPMIANHVLLQVVVLLVVFIRTCQKKIFSFQISQDVGFILGLCYLAAGFHKLNDDFFNPDVSCVTRFLSDGGLTLMPIYSWDLRSWFFGNNSSKYISSADGSLITWLAWSTVILELLAGVVLVIQRRCWPILFAMVLFHITIGVREITSFSVFAFAMIWLQVSDKISVRLHQRILHFIWMIAFAQMLYLVALSTSDQYANLVMRLSVSVLSLCVLVIFSEMLIEQIRNHKKWSFFIWQFTGSGSASWLRRSVGLILLLNFSAPYLGLKHSYSASMYSNLRTEGGMSNHWLWPKGKMLFSPLRCIVNADHPHPEQFLTPSFLNSEKSPPVFYQNVYSLTVNRQILVRTEMLFQDKTMTPKGEKNSLAPFYCDGHSATIDDVLSNTPDYDSWWFRNIVANILRFKPVSFPQLCEW